MTNKTIGFFAVLWALSGCAGAGSDDATGGGAEEGAEPSQQHGAVGSDAEGTALDATSAAVGMAMVGLAMPFEVFGAPEARVDACVALSIPLSDPGAGHAPAFSGDAGGQGCFAQHDGMTLMLLPANSHVMLGLTGAGMMPAHLLLTTSGEPADMKPVRLPGDAVIAAAYDGVEPAAALHPYTAVIETPADGATVTLTSGRQALAARPVYVDAEGRVSGRSTSAAGGWAIFPNLPQGVHVVSMKHAELRCAPSTLGSWSDEGDDAITLVTMRDPQTLPIVPSSVAHSNAFDCR